MRSVLGVSNVLSIVAAIVGVVSYCVMPSQFATVVLLICAGVCMLHSLLNVSFGDQNNLATEIVTIIVGVIVALVFKFNMRNTICMAICIAELLISGISYIMLALMIKK